MGYDAIVLGVGGMGSAAVYHLARRGARVLGIERFGIPHDRGSSHGISRIIRLAYWEHPDYVPLVRRAYDLWGELEQTVSERLLIVTGSIDGGLPDGRTIRGSLSACRTHGLEHDVLDAAALSGRFPGYRLPDDHVAVFQPEGGFLLAERCTAAHARAARAAGADVHVEERAIAWTAAGDGVQVTTDRATYRAGRLVITAGPWLPAVVPALARHVTVERQVVLWTWPLRPELFASDRFPVFYIDTPRGSFYGFPLDPARGFKIGKYHHLRQRTDPESVDRAFSAADESTLRDGIAHYFPDANGPTASTSTCLFTNTPDEHFIIDRLPDHPEVVIAGGFSGHGFKFCSVVGEMVADLVLDKASSRISLFAIDRL
ncbi:MAG TPA: N-methyl-L-tryptophan oxidase [Vicinamibacterales bacterium]|nr:N-methyl-L-tryptophan oxidase [Vicinamibacterales bacterium]